MLERGWREVPEPLNPPACWHWQVLQEHTPTQRDTVVEVPFPIPKSSIREAQGEAHSFWALEWLPTSCCCMRDISNTSGLYARARNIPCCSRGIHAVTCIQQAWLEPQPWAPWACVCYLPHLSVSLRSCSLGRTGERVNPSVSTRV